VPAEGHLTDTETPEEVVYVPVLEPPAKVQVPPVSVQIAVFEDAALVNIREAYH
jgi:hypothetical protein